MIYNNLFFILLLFSAVCFADVFHYNNVIPGDRAMGLGGAYSAISDDSSGVIYNPAGIAFAMNDDISGSANAFYWKKTTYEKTIVDKSFEESSRGFLPSFVGAVKKVDFLGGMTLGFAIYPGDFESKDQNDLIRMPEANIMSFHRTVNKNTSTLYLGSSVAKRLFGSFSLGLGLNVIIINELEQVYQDAVQKTNIKLSDTSKNKGFVLLSTTDNSRQHLSATGLEPHLGIQYSLLNNLVVGFSTRFPILLAEKLTYHGDSSFVYKFQDDTVVQPTDLETSPESGSRVGTGKSYKQTPFQETTSDGLPKLAYTLNNSLERLPYELRLGFAWFATPSVLFASDVSYRSAVETELSLYNRKSVINYNLGTEIYLIPAFPIRLGYFTNKDTRPTLVKNKTDQNDHIDYWGTSCFLGWSQSNSQISVGGVYQKGSGKAQKIRNSYRIQNVKSQSIHIAFSASHSF